MRLFILFVIVFIFGSCLSGCATIARGSQDTMVVSTEPVGAKVTTDRELEKSIKARKEDPDFKPVYYGCLSTPCEFKVPRKSEFIMTIEKEGYETIEIGVDSGIHKESLNANLAGSAGIGVAMGLTFGTAVATIPTIGTGTAVGAGATAGAVVALPILATSLIIDGSSGALLNLRPNPIALVLPPEGTTFEPHPKVKAIREKRAAESKKKSQTQKAESS